MEMPTGDALRVDAIQHIYRDPVRSPPDQSCHNDVMCFPAWADTAKACGGIGFISQNSIFCSGQLLNTLAGDQTPYFLTAAQCIGTMAEAQSSEIFFKYQTPTCNGVPPAITSVPRATGCTLLAANTTLDFSLLMVDGTLPSGLSWAGWISGAVADGALAACIHFPLGEFERISFGAKSSDPTCGGPGFVRMNWTSGPTEPGSVGGGVFLDAPGQPLFGQLACGPSTCASVTSDDFGSFSAAYPAISALLAAGSDDSFEPNDSCDRPRAMSLGSFPGLVAKSTDEDWYSVFLEPGETLSAEALFTHANGDIDVEMFSVCGGPPLAVSAGQTGWESAAWTNGGVSTQSVLIRVFLASDTRNTYTLTLSTSVPPGSGACCLPGGGCAIRTSAGCIGLGGVFAGSETTCAGSCSTTNYVGAPVLIADGIGTSTCGPMAIAQVNVVDSFRIAGARVGVRIAHAYQGDLKFSLKHVPTGTTVSLVDRPGVPQTTFGFPNDNYGASLTDLFLSLDSAPQRYDWPAQAMNNVNGWWRPEGALQAFAGENSSGNWQLLVQDCAFGESGEISAFELTLAAARVVPCPANCDGSTGVPVLTGNDFQCFMNLYTAGSSLANCDGSTGIPALTANDFQCFMQLYAAGCR